MTALELQALYRESMSPLVNLGQMRLARAGQLEQRALQEVDRSRSLQDAQDAFMFEQNVREQANTRTRDAKRGDALKNGEALLRMQDQFDALNAEFTQATQLTPEQEARIAVAAARQAGMDEKRLREIAKDPKKLFVDAGSAKDRLKLSDAREIFQTLVQQQTAANAAQPKAMQVQRQLARVSRDMDLFTRTADIALDPELLVNRQAKAQEPPAAAGMTVADAITAAAAEAKAKRDAAAAQQQANPLGDLPVPDDVRAALQQRSQASAAGARASTLATLQRDLQRRREEMGVVDQNFADVAAQARGVTPRFPIMVSPTGFTGGAGFGFNQQSGVDPQERAIALGQKKQQLQNAIDSLAAQLGELQSVDTPPTGMAFQPQGQPDSEAMKGLLLQRAEALRGASPVHPALWGMYAPGR